MINKTRSQTLIFTIMPTKMGQRQRKRICWRVWERYSMYTEVKSSITKGGSCRSSRDPNWSFTFSWIVETLGAPHANCTLKINILCWMLALGRSLLQLKSLREIIFHGCKRVYAKYCNASVAGTQRLYFIRSLDWRCSLILEVAVNWEVKLDLEMLKRSQKSNNAIRNPKATAILRRQICCREQYFLCTTLWKRNGARWSSEL